MSRYIVSPVAWQPGRARIYDTQKQRHIKSESGGDTFLYAVAVSKARRMNAEMIGKMKGGAA